MSAGQVTLDFSKAQPVGAPGGVQLDFSKAQRLDTGASKETPGFLDKEIPLDSYGNATLSGVQSIGRGIRGAVQGIGQTIEHPIDTAKSIGDIPSQAMQIPGAIRDINASPDPLGTYAKAAQDTAGQGAGQALVALGTEGIGKGIKAAAPPIIRGVAKGTNTVLKRAAGPVGAVVGAGIGHATGIPAAGEVGAAVGYGIGNEVIPRIKVPGENFGIAKPVYPGAPLPETPSPELLQARGIGQGGRAVEEPSQALGRIVRPTNIKPEAVPERIAPVEALPAEAKATAPQIIPHGNPRLAPDIASWQPPPELGVMSAPDYGAAARADVERRMGGALPRGVAERRIAPPNVASPQIGSPQIMEAPDANGVSEEEWNASRFIEPEVEGTPRPDLTEELQKSLEMVNARKAAKSARVAAPRIAKAGD